MSPESSRLHPVLAERRSRRGLAEAPLAPEHVESLLEAARWAPSSGNEQPWLIFYATSDRPAGLAKLRTLPDAGNYWTQRAPFLAVFVARKTFENVDWAEPGEPNRFAEHDTGMALVSLLYQAAALGLAARPFGGYDVEKARLLLRLGPDEEPMAMVAVGHADPEAPLKAHHALAEAAARERLPFSKFVRRVE